MTLHGENMVGGRLSAEGRTRFRAVDPTTNSEIEPAFSEAGADEIRQAAELADTAARDPVLLDTARRAALLRRIGAEIEALGDRLIQRCSRETGLPEGRIAAERGRTLAQLGMFADLVEEGSWVDARIDTAQPERTPVARPDLRRMLIPLGPVAIFGASNFPLAFSVAGGDTAAALAAGNPVIVKAHPSHPGTSELVGDAIRRAAGELQLPDGIFSLLHGKSPETGAALVRHPMVRAVGFTGSPAGGRALFDLAASRPDPIPVYAEMGSTNPVFVLPGALREQGEAIAQALAGSVTLGVGQFCTKPGLVFGERSAQFDQWIEAVGSAVRAVTPGTMLSSAICRRYNEGVAELDRLDGVEPVGSTADAGENREQAGVLEAGATIGRPLAFVTDVLTLLANPSLREEVFGPVVLFVRAQSRSELLRAAEALQGQLTVTLHGSEQELEDYAELPAILRRKAGRVIFNGFPTGVEVCPSMNHGGPYPATTDVHFTSVGTAAILRFARPVCYQNLPDAALPPELQRANPRGILRLVDGSLNRLPLQ